MESEKVKRVLPADVYDTLELSALAFGGIGRVYEFEPTGEPCCAYGHAFNAVGVAPEAGQLYVESEQEKGAVRTALRRSGVTVFKNDDAVATILDRKGLEAFTKEGRRQRVTFEEWRSELGIERGD